MKWRCLRPAGGVVIPADPWQRGIGEVRARQPTHAAVELARRTRSRTRIAALLMYAVALLVWIRAFGVPSDTVQIFLWLWLAPSPGTSRRPGATTWASCATGGSPVAALVVYFYSRGLADEFGLPRTSRCRSPSTPGWAAGCCRRSGCRTRLRQAVRPLQRPALVRRPVHHRLHHALRGRPDDRDGAVAAQPREWIKWMRRYIGANCAALVVYIVYPMAPPWMAWEEGYLPHEVLRITTAAGPTPAWAASTSSSPASATRSPRCRRCTPASRSWSRSTASSGCGRPGGGCSRSTRWLMSFALVYYGEHYVIDIVAGCPPGRRGAGRVLASRTVRGT